MRTCSILFLGRYFALGSLQLAPLITASEWASLFGFSDAFERTPEIYLFFLVVNGQPTILSIPHKGRRNVGREHVYDHAFYQSTSYLAHTWGESKHPAGEVAGYKRALLSLFPHLPLR